VTVVGRIECYRRRMKRPLVDGSRVALEWWTTMVDPVWAT